MAHEAASSGLAGSLPGRGFLKARDEGRVEKRGPARRGRSQSRGPQRTAWATPTTIHTPFAGELTQEEARLVGAAIRERLLQTPRPATRTAPRIRPEASTPT
jgi:hypothetical protein